MSDATAHLTDAILFPHLLDGAPLSEAESAHLAACPACRTALDQAAALTRSLAIARHSRPTPAALAAAQALFAHVQSQSLAERLAGRLRALLSIDTRRSAVAGVRGAAAAYRLLYTTSAADLELAVEPLPGAPGLRRIEGELLPLVDAGEILPALVQVEADDRIAPLLEAQTGADGRFRLDAAPGRYRVWVTFAAGGDLLIEGLELG